MYIVESKGVVPPPVRVLHVLNNLGSGGAESLVMNLYRAIDRSRVQFDFMLRSTENNFYADEIRQLGGRIYIMPSFPRQLFANIRAGNQFFASHPEYQIIHVHANALIYTIPLILAKRHGIPCRIIHSHSCSTFAGSIGHLLHKINRCLIGGWATDFFACSSHAAQWMFGKHPYIHIKNGIDLKKYQYSPEARETIRKKHGIGTEFVVGHVGRFTPVKNHEWILKVFKQVLGRRPDAKLLLVGEGSLQGLIEQKIKNEGIQEHVIMTGSVCNVHEYLSAMDAFIFPSFFEGLGTVLVEAQANGLPCVMSDVIPEEARRIGELKVLSLEDSPQAWADALLLHQRNETGSPTLEDFDIHAIAEKMGNFYCVKGACVQA